MFFLDSPKETQVFLKGCVACSVPYVPGQFDQLGDRLGGPDESVLVGADRPFQHLGEAPGLDDVLLRPGLETDRPDERLTSR
jgi:hypothetical protein